jgi:hypothetical protein
MNSATSTLTTRLAWVVWPYRNPVARSSDKVESVSLAVAVLIALLLGPVMLVFGSIVHANLAASGEQQARTRHPAVAVLTQDAPDDGAGGHGSAFVGKSSVPARWQEPDGTTAVGRVRASNGLDAGAKEPIWLDERGRVVDRPLNESDAAAGGTLVALGGWLAAVALLACAQTGVHRVLDRRRYRDWGQEWERVEPGWNNYRR